MQNLWQLEFLEGITLSCGFNFKGSKVELKSKFWNDLFKVRTQLDKKFHKELLEQSKTIAICGFLTTNGQAILHQE